MATQAQIFGVRLIVDDPHGFVNIVSVADTTALPAAPAPQTCYYVASTGVYVATEKTSGAAAADYTPQEISISDTRIGAAYDAGGESSAVKACYQALVAKLGKAIILKKSEQGGESSEVQALSEMLAYYKQCLASYESTTTTASSGLFLTIAQPEINGGAV